MEGNRLDGKFIFVNDSAGKVTPKKNPNTIPTKVVTTSLIVSLGFLTVELRRGVPILEKKNSQKNSRNRCKQPQRHLLIIDQLSQIQA
nr:hypothetical protein Iba_chr11dCG1380 [Ipomoea batatas]